MNPENTIKLYIVRHGQSISNTRRGFISGRSDPDGLTDLGRVEVIRHAWEYHGESIDKIISSPVERTKETARIFKHLFNASIDYEDRLSELDHGRFEGKHWKEVIDEIPHEWGADIHEDYTTAYPEGESFQMLAQRTREAYLDFVNRAQKDTTYMIVTHQAIIGTLLYSLSRGNPDDQPGDYMEFIHTHKVKNGAIVPVRIDQETASGTYTLPDALQPVSVSGSTIQFYAAGTLGSARSARTEPVKTISRNSVFIVNTDQPDQDDILFKVLSDTHSLTGRRIYRLYNYLDKETPIPAPRVLHYDNSGYYFTDDIMIQDYAIGIGQHLCLKSHPDALKDTYQTLYTHLKQIHAISVSEVTDFWYPDDWKDRSHPDWVTYLTTEIDHTMKFLPDPELDSQARNFVKEKLSELAEYIESCSYAHVPLHGDLAPDNLVINHQTGECVLVRILDFERARIGDPVWDYLYFYGKLERYAIESAEQWRTIFWNDFNKKQKNAFWLYHILFHAWSLRDAYQYSNDPRRGEDARLSHDLLERLARDH